MRIWDLPPSYLCNNHLLGEHRELHALWKILTENKNGYRNHPETKRWIGKQEALFMRHDLLIKEFKKRSFSHFSDLDPVLATGVKTQKEYINTLSEQIEILKLKNCLCGN